MAAVRGIPAFVRKDFGEAITGLGRGGLVRDQGEVAFDLRSTGSAMRQ
jgi:hypothetical protein